MRRFRVETTTFDCGFMNLFERLHAQDEYAGTGIGLVLGERIVDRHVGDILVESEPDEDMTVSWTLPAPGD